ncbi:MAG: hypothetical protein H5U40_12600, partial [Polyangiaceae bacterium]|nr:hypothetical protein [Polyangiaceae bacterium]
MNPGKPTFELLRPSSAELRRSSAPPDTAVFGLTHPGSVRANNEDQFLVAKLERSVILEQSGFEEIDREAPTRVVDEPAARLLMVADGMGGHNAGEVASSVVVDSMANYAFSMMPWLGGAAALDETTEEDLRKAVE